MKKIWICWILFLVSGTLWGAEKNQALEQTFNLALQVAEQEAGAKEGNLLISWQKCEIKEFRVRTRPGKKIYIPWNCQEKVTSCRVKIFNDYVSAKPACFVPPQHEEDEKVTLEKITLQAFNGAKLTFRSSEILLPLPN
ncbi:MAG: hypothetical protein IKB61_02240 [Elusimicrobiaceae bacterium]|nr:hypothetical protein [Elusimicrobiaceae bacterium]